mgnify:CR=1 FL=1
MLMIIVMLDWFAVMNFMSVRAKVMAAETVMAGAKIMSTKVMVENSTLVLLFARFHGLHFLFFGFFLLRGNA